MSYRDDPACLSFVALLVGPLLAGALGILLVETLPLCTFTRITPTCMLLFEGLPQRVLIQEKKI